MHQAFSWMGSIVDLSMPDHFRRGTVADNLPEGGSTGAEEATED